MIWKAESYPVHLCGSIHVLHKKQKPLLDRYAQYISSADTIAFETDLANTHQIDNTLLYYPSGLSIQNDIPKKLYKEARKLWDVNGVMGIELDQLTPCTAATWMFFNYVGQRGYLEANGVDQTLLANARKDQSKTFIALEDINAPLRAFDSALKEEQVQYLETITYHLKDQFRELESMIQAIMRSDDQWLLDYLEKYLALYPTLFDKLILERNRNWLPKLLEIIELGKPAAIVVGALHCVGPQGLLELLSQNGIPFQGISD